MTIIIDMFRSLRRANLPPNHVFAVTIGAASKMTLASWHLLEPEDVIDTLASLVGTDEGTRGDEQQQQQKEVQSNGSVVGKEEGISAEK